jgi:hypothetical protein
MKVRNKKTGVVQEWSSRTYDLNKKAMENGTVPFEVVGEEEIPAPLPIEDFLNSIEKKSVDVVVAKAPEVAPEKEVALDTLTVKELRQLCEDKGLPTNGNKNQLISRYENSK